MYCCELMLISDVEAVLLILFIISWCQVIAYSQCIIDVR